MSFLPSKTVRALFLLLALCGVTVGLWALEEKDESAGADAGTPAAGAADAGARLDMWPQHRGPGGRGISLDDRTPIGWTEEDVLWKTPIPGRGHSAPAIFGSRIYLTTAIEGEVIPGAKAPVHLMNGQEFKHPDSVGSDKSHRFEVLAIDAGTGEVVWSKVAYEGRVYDDRHKASSYASPTVAVDAETVIAYFGSQGVYAYDHGGELLWQRDVGKIATVGMGVGTSPLLFWDLVILQADEDNGEHSFIVALDKKTGEEVWKTKRPIQVSWSTPVLAYEEEGTAHLLTSGYELVISYDPKTGEERWRAKGLESNAIHTPLVWEETVVFTAGYPQKVIFALPLDLEGDVSAADRTLWKYNKGTAYVPSNLVYDGRVYLFNDGGVVTCLDAATGEVVYEGGRFPERGRFMASPIVVDGRILMISNDGDVAFVTTGPEFEVEATASVGEPVFASPAAAGGRLYIRGEEHLIAIGRGES